MLLDDPRDDGRFPAEGPVSTWHADRRSGAELRAEGLTASEGGVIWVASGPDIAELHASRYEVNALAELRVDASALMYERSHDGLHLFYFLADVPFEMLNVSA